MESPEVKVGSFGSSFSLVLTSGGAGGWEVTSGVDWAIAGLPEVGILEDWFWALSLLSSTKNGSSESVSLLASKE